MCIGDIKGVKMFMVFFKLFLCGNSLLKFRGFIVFLVGGGDKIVCMVVVIGYMCLIE